MPRRIPRRCDAAVPAIIGRNLTGANKPQFVYWLTLNTHVPVVSDTAMGTAHCTTGSKQWRTDFPALCRLFQLHSILGDRISDMVMAPDLPPTDILIVGEQQVGRNRSTM